MKALAVQKQDRPDGAIDAVFYENATRGVYSLFAHDSPFSKVSIESEKDFSFVEKKLEGIVQCVVAPHPRLSYMFHVQYISAPCSAFDVYTDAVTALSVLMVHAGIEATDTLVPYVKEFPNGSVWVCKKFFKNEIVSMKTSGLLSKSEAVMAAEYIPNQELSGVKKLLGLL
ncbi:uncharacterized protein NEMAJ01_1486 [Nematocida major]|uniref:uncharacterized protein n=1 Tax=Nematocida major TaxID=1912982 RepID=UPI00200827D6|nr:uncharacterized protein NEMAJ01_1486 [Nematocida major]KAH9386590.1 hypothetical protein NEMAJ01_1486 [Nematocida major]